MLQRKQALLENPCMNRKKCYLLLSPSDDKFLLSNRLIQVKNLTRLVTFGVRKGDKRQKNFSFKHVPIKQNVTIRFGAFLKSFICTKHDKSTEQKKAQHSCHLVYQGEGTLSSVKSLSAHRAGVPDTSIAKVVRN